MALPKATQLMRHGFMQEVPSLARGDLPGGLAGGWLAHVNYVYSGTMDLERSPFTLALVQAPESLAFAVRVLCHDRGMSERDRDDPDAGRRIVELDDRGVKLESESFLKRYALETDHDQEQLAVWQLFDPSLIDWLTEDAPAGFSFELQDGALACFRPGFITDPAELDALCAGAARVFHHVDAIRRERGEVGERDEEIERELAAHPFDEPPRTTREAARAFRRGVTIGDRGWKLGAEAFFRSHAEAIGFEPVPLSAYRAGHVDTFLPGVPAHAARGAIGGVDCHLVLTNNDDHFDMGWSVLLATLTSPVQGMALTAQIPRGDAAERGSLMAGSDGRSLILSTLDGGARDRKAEELEAFLAAGGAIVARLDPARG